MPSPTTLAPPTSSVPMCPLPHCLPCTPPPISECPSPPTLLHQPLPVVTSPLPISPFRPPPYPGQKTASSLHLPQFLSTPSPLSTPLLPSLTPRFLFPIPSFLPTLHHVYSTPIHLTRWNLTIPATINWTRIPPPLPSNVLSSPLPSWPTPAPRMSSFGSLSSLPSPTSCAHSHSHPCYLPFAPDGSILTATSGSHLQFRRLPCPVPF